MQHRVLLLAAAAVPLLLGLWFLTGGRDAQTQPPAPDPALAMVAVRLPSLNEEQQAGRTLYGQYCAACHGPDGAGQAGIGPPLVHIVYETGHHPDGAFHAAVQLGVRAHHWRFGDMPPVAGITEAETEAVIGFIRAVQRENGIF